MGKWKGESRGNVLGYKIFIFWLRNFGLGFTYFFLYFVVFYFLLFSGKAFRYAWNYFRRIHGYGRVKSLFKVYENYYIFGQTLLDKIALRAVLKQKFEFRFDGREIFENVVSKNQGVILISAHVGNFEMAAESMNLEGKSVSIVTMDAERADIKQYLETQGAQKGLRFVPVEEDLSHIFKIAKAINDKGIVCFTGDRYKEGVKFFEATFMGKTAKFPAGPFEVAVRLKVPVVFVFGMKASRNCYQFYGRLPQNNANATPETLLHEFIVVLEEIVKQYPEQWFNFYDFWDLEKN